MPKPKKALVKMRTKAPKAPKRKGGGGKLSRSETVQVRLDPKLKFAADLAARKHRRTISSFIEWAVDKAVNEISVGLKEDESAWQVTESVWNVDEAERFVNLVQNYPNILTHDEGLLWKHICESFVFWKVSWEQADELEFRKNPRKFDLRFLRRGFDNLKNFSKGAVNEEELFHQLDDMKEDPQYKIEEKLREKKNGSKI